MDRQQKALVIEGLNEKASRARAAIVTDFKGLTVEEMTNLRVKLREAGCDYQVVKNTLARRAMKDTSHEILNDLLKENCAVAFAYEDPVALAKALMDYAKTSKKFQLKFGSLMGKHMDAESIKELSRLPGRPELLAKMLGTMNAVPTGFVSLLANVTRGLLYALTAIKDQKEQQA